MWSSRVPEELPGSWFSAVQGTGHVSHLKFRFSFTCCSIHLIRKRVGQQKVFREENKGKYYLRLDSTEAAEKVKFYRDKTEPERNDSESKAIEQNRETRKGKAQHGKIKALPPTRWFENIIQHYKSSMWSQLKFLPLIRLNRKTKDTLEGHENITLELLWQNG